VRHGKAGFKLGRSSSHRRALFRNLMTALFKYERIKTTEAKAKAIRGEAERMITLAKTGDLASRRRIMQEITDKSIVDKLIHVIGPDMHGRPGGYTRIIKLGPRAGDAAPMVFIELVEKM
jgi:large subunit ribosomal protein L17